MLDNASIHRASPASIFSGRPLARGERIQIALLIGIAAAICAWAAFQILPGMMARDFTYPWRGARAVLAGQDPYVVIRPSGPAPNDHWFMYPLTAALAVIPLAPLKAQIAGAIFVAVTVTTMAYVFSKDGLARCWVFTSVPFLLSAVLAQWTPLLSAASLVPWLAWALTCKPTIGLALFAYRPSWRAAFVCAAFLGIAFLVQPPWFGEWIHKARSAEVLQVHYAPVTRPFGWIPLLAFLRWRRPEARLVGLMALVPQNFYFYDQLPLWLVARSGRGALALSAFSWVAWIGTMMRCGDVPYCGWGAEPLILGLLYAPATAMVLIDRESVAAVRAWVVRRRAR